MIFSKYREIVTPDSPVMNPPTTAFGQAFSTKSKAISNAAPDKSVDRPYGDDPQ
jgi:hypothetical protein